jgi:hypothetical protein
MWLVVPVPVVGRSRWVQIVVSLDQRHVLVPEEGIIPLQMRGVLLKNSVLVEWQRLVET